MLTLKKNDFCVPDGQYRVHQPQQLQGLLAEIRVVDPLGQHAQISESQGVKLI